MIKFFKKLQKKSEELEANRKSGALKNIDILMEAVEGKRRLGAWETGKVIGSILGHGVYGRAKVDYLGGSPHATKPRERATVVPVPQGILTDAIAGLKGFIPFTAIKKIDLKSKQQIEKDVTLTRFLAFGFYALAMKKERKTVHQFLTIEVCEVDGMEYTLLFTGEQVTKLYADIMKVKLEQYQ